MDTFSPPPQPLRTTNAIINTTFAAPTTANTIPTSAHADVQSTLNNLVANPTLSPGVGPGKGSSASTKHPPYAEMIYSAIGALKKRHGSSKRAIAKYIEQAYTGLPPTHSALLTHHLKRLKNIGLLVMVKKSYKLPRSDSSAAASPTPAPPTSGSHRGRGRPPKPKPDCNAQPAIQPIVQPAIQFNIQPTAKPIVQLNGQISSQPDAQPNSQPALLALGLVDEPNSAFMRKRPGHLRKALSVGVAQGEPGFVKRGHGRPPASKGKLSEPTRLSKKSPVCPQKPKSVLGVLGPKRGPRRPSKPEPKTMIIPYATNVPVVGVVDQNSIPNVLAVPPRPRGRPKKIAGTAGNAAGVGILSGKRRGRPPKVAGINKLKNSTSRRVVRPREDMREGGLPHVELSHDILETNNTIGARFYGQRGGLRIEEPVEQTNEYVNSDNDPFVPQVRASLYVETPASPAGSSVASSSWPIKKKHGKSKQLSSSRSIRKKHGKSKRLSFKETALQCLKQIVDSLSRGSKSSASVKNTDGGVRCQSILKEMGLDDDLYSASIDFFYKHPNWCDNFLAMEPKQRLEWLIHRRNLPPPPLPPPYRPTHVPNSRCRNRLFIAALLIILYLMSE